MVKDGAKDVKLKERALQQCTYIVYPQRNETGPRMTGLQRANESSLNTVSRIPKSERFDKPNQSRSGIPVRSEKVPKAPMRGIEVSLGTDCVS